MNIIENYILENDFKSLTAYLSSYENRENDLRIILYPLIEKYGLTLINTLLELAYLRDVSFWFNQIGYFLSFQLSHLIGSERMALAMFKKSFEIDPDDTLTLQAILDFNFPPTIILTDTEYNYYSKILQDR